MLTVKEESPLAMNKFGRMWEKAEREFEIKTGRKLRGAVTAETPQNLVDKFIAKLAPKDNDDSGSRRKQKAARVVGFVLSFVKTMGGFASQAASMVFGGPADMCFNAFSFILDIPTKIGKVYDDLVKLFGEMSTTLLEFQVLEKISGKQDIDEELLTTTHAILIAFVNICGRYIKFLEGGKLHHITVAFRSVFLDDDCGVLDELKNFQNLARQQSSMIGTVSYKHILDIEEAIKDYGVDQHLILDHVQTLVASDNDRKTEILLQKSLKAIEEKLRVRSDAAGVPLAELTQTEEEVVDEVCQWVYDAHEYQKWIDRGSKEHLLCIAGGEKSGKKFLLAAIARRFKRKNAVRIPKEFAPIILYYGFSSNEAKRLSRKIDAVNLSLKVLALQYAQQHPKYARDLENSMSHLESLEEKDASTLWTSLKISDSLSSSDHEVYMFLSGLNYLSDEDAHNLLNVLANTGKKKTKMPKILVTGTSTTFSTLDSSALVINIAQYSDAGMRRYIENEMSKIDILQDEHSNIRSLRETILEQLPHSVNKNFFAVKQKLSRVSNAIYDNKTEAEILDVLDEDMNSDSDELMKERINDLERILTADDITDLNVILPRLVYGFVDPDVSELEAILLLHGRAHSVLPLERRLRKKYSTIIQVVDSVVSLVDGLGAFFRFKDSRGWSTTDTNTRISLKIDIEGAERSVVKRFLWDLNERFNFDHPTFTGLENDQQSRIGVDQVEAQLSIIDICLQCLSEESDPETNALQEYSLNNLPAHLEQLHDLNLNSPKTKTLCQKLINLFSDTSMLEDKWVEVHLGQTEWFTLSTVQIIESMFANAEQHCRFEPVERRWIAKYVRQEKDRGAFLRSTALQVAKIWLQSRDRDSSCCYECINSFIEVQLSRGQQDRQFDEQSDGGSGSADSSASATEDRSLSISDKITRAFEWSVENLKLDKPNALYYERVATVLLWHDEDEKATELLEKARELPGLDWHINKQLADAYGRIGRQEDSQKQLMAAITDPHFDAKGSDLNTELVNLLNELAAAERRSGQDEAALDHYQRVLDLEPSEHDSFWKCFKILCETGQIEKAGLLVYNDQEEDVVSAAQILCERLRFVTGRRILDDEIAYWLTVLMRQSQIAEAVEGAFERINNETGLTSNRRAYYTFNYGFLLSHSKVPGARLKALRHLEQCLIFTSPQRIDFSNDDGWLFSDWWVPDLRRKSAQRLSLLRALSISSMQLDDPVFATAHGEFVSTIKAARDSPEYNSFQTYATVISYLCEDYVARKQYDEARDLLRSDVQDAFVILEDEDPENDHVGYRLLAESFKLSGDDDNALTAWSLITPPDLDNEHQDDAPDGSTHSDESAAQTPSETTTADNPQQSRFFNHNCSGCHKELLFADDFWVCKHCPEVQFCSKCYDLLKNEKLDRLVCYYEHKFLHVPPWSDAEYRDVGKGRVRIGGQLGTDGRRVGGRVVTVEEWLDSVRQIWNIKPKAVEGEQAESKDG